MPATGRRTVSFALASAVLAGGCLGDPTLDLRIQRLETVLDGGSDPDADAVAAKLFEYLDGPTRKHLAWLNFLAGYGFDLVADPEYQLPAQVAVATLLGVDPMNPGLEEHQPGYFGCDAWTNAKSDAIRAIHATGQARFGEAGLKCDRVPGVDPLKCIAAVLLATIGAPADDLAMLRTCAAPLAPVTKQGGYADPCDAEGRWYLSCRYDDKPTFPLGCTARTAESVDVEVDVPRSVVSTGGTWQHPTMGVQFELRVDACAIDGSPTLDVCKNRPNRLDLNSGTGVVDFFCPDFCQRIEWPCEFVR